MLSSVEIAQKYCQRSDWRGLRVLVKDLLLLCTTLYVAKTYGDILMVSIAAIVFVGILQFALGESLLHEASHGNLFSRKFLNRMVGNLVACSILTTFSGWQQEHRVHHRDLLSEADHLSQDYKDYQLSDNLHPTLLWIVRPLFGVIGFRWILSELPGLFKHARVFVFYCVIVGFCFWTNTLNLFLLYWVLPLVWIYPSILYWSEITDHYLADKTRSNDSWLWNLLFHNGGYHWLHHQYPFIPWYLLPQSRSHLDDSQAPFSTERERGRKGDRRYVCLAQFAELRSGT